MKCIVCKKEFNDIDTHLFGKSEGLLEIQDKKHQKYFDLIMKTGFKEKGEAIKKCFCGGKIVMYGWAHEDGDASWETACERCGLLIDAD
jgi:hypothetical protein